VGLVAKLKSTMTNVETKYLRLTLFTAGHTLQFIRW